MDNYDFYAGKVLTFLPLVILSIIAVILIWPNSRKKFLRIQASLPTSKINSVAMGLVEIQGKLIMKEPLISPVAKEQCIGYYYTIEDITKDKDGKDSYTTIHRETKCNVFEMQDDSGTIEIQAEGIELILLKETNVDFGGQKRYTETLLKNGQEMLLVGSADSRNGHSYIRKDAGNKILGITSVAGISVWNKYQPLLRSFLFTCIVISVLIILILSQ
ncbi:hypothetical protein [Chryseobacterium limigenitum]|uniref:RING-type E3 ubiquitin transferase n=1 Tax=Chryseobacterium limigenitum TaxID=1612149 RepID=A0A1K2IJW5_9FLAO|nr:hypothetical protein [Chryseobacterium limigenitum]SFZ92562.1 hypothetical protein SAMN05216324_103322 [Chryseobacterium limigenitum]